MFSELLRKPAQTPLTAPALVGYNTLI